jgi:hypothetical protein
MSVNGLICRREPAEVHLHDPQTLYRHWEDQQWSPFTDALGASSDEIRDFAISGLSRRLKVIGVPLESL